MQEEDIIEGGMVQKEGMIEGRDDVDKRTL